MPASIISTTTALAVHKHLANGDRDLHRWLEEYGIEPAVRSP